MKPIRFHFFFFFQFVTFEALSKYSYRLFPEFHKEQLTLIHFMCGAAAGGFATICSFPFDVVRTRLVAQGEPKVCCYFFLL